MSYQKEPLYLLDMSKLMELAEKVLRILNNIERLFATTARTDYDLALIEYQRAQGAYTSYVNQIDFFDYIGLVPEKRNNARLLASNYDRLRARHRIIDLIDNWIQRVELEAPYKLNPILSFLGITRKRKVPSRDMPYRETKRHRPNYNENS